MTQYSIKTICEEYFADNGGRGLHHINTDNLSMTAENVSWTQSEPAFGPKNGSVRTIRGATTQAQFSKGETNSMDMNITAKSDYSSTVRVYLQKGLVKDLNKKLFLNFDPAIRNRFGSGVHIDPSKSFNEDLAPKQSKIQTSSSNMGREVSHSTAEVSSYQEAYSGRFTCDVVLCGQVIFVGQGGTVQQDIKEVMKGRSGITIRWQNVILKMEGECELRKDAKPEIKWI